MTLSDSMAKHPKPFDKLYFKMIAAGEVGGVLDQILHHDAITKPAELLSRLNRKIRQLLGQDRTDGSSDSGLDVGLLRIDNRDRTAEFAGAFERALDADRPALIELRLDPEAITPSATLSGIRDAALSSKS